MRNNGEREAGKAGTRRPILSQIDNRQSSVLSFPITDREDFDILSSAKEGPFTVLRMCERTGLSFVECLHRIIRLERAGLLKRLGTRDTVHGLILYALGL